MTENNNMKDDKRSVGRPKKSVKLDKKQEVRCLETEKENWKEAAEISGISTSEFMRVTANKEAAKILKRVTK
jgi:uncharacterized protein (DUF1778 family)